MPEKARDEILLECQDILKNSADSPEDMSLMSSSRESFLESWNNTRSRKSTLTQSLNEFSANQQVLYERKQNARDKKEGFLLARQLQVANSQDSRWWFKIEGGELRQHECGDKNDEAGELVRVYDLSSVKKCYLHPDRHYCLVVEFADSKLQLKGESSGEARGWVKNIYEEISSLGACRPSRAHPHQQVLHSLKSREVREGSTMDHSPLLKDQSRSREKVSRPVTPVRSKQKTPLSRGSREGGVKASRGKKESEAVGGGEECLGCSRGFFL